MCIRDRDTLALIKYIADEDKLEKILENPSVIRTPVVRNGKQSTLCLLYTSNKDTFFDIRRYMNSGNDRIMGREFGTVIYGAGKGIWKTFEDYVNGAERYFLGKNALFYFGDLDFEGILIFEHLIGQKQYRESGIHIFKEAYEKMLDKAWQLGFSRLPDMKEKQNANIGTSFLSAFDRCV